MAFHRGKLCRTNDYPHAAIPWGLAWRITKTRSPGRDGVARAAGNHCGRSIVQPIVQGLGDLEPVVLETGGFMFRTNRQDLAIQRTRLG